MDGYWVWCGSAVKSHKDGRYHLFAARWSKKLPMFEGYILTSEIVRAVADVPQGPYEFAEKIIPFGDDLTRWDGRMAHNPTVQYRNGKYYLFYIGSTFEGPIPESIDTKNPPELCGVCYKGIKIGLLSAEEPEGPWHRQDAPLLLPRPGKWDHQVVTNPAPCILPNGTTYLYYRGNTPSGLRIGLAVAPRPEGPYERVQDDPVLEGFNVEDPFVWHDGERFLMIAKDISGNITGEKNAGAFFQSPDGIKWATMPEAKAYSKTVKYEDGSVRDLGCFERPQILFDERGTPLCAFAAAADGPGHFRNAINTWNIAIPMRSR